MVRGDDHYQRKFSLIRLVLTTFLSPNLSHP